MIIKYYTWGVYTLRYKQSSSPINLRLSNISDDCMHVFPSFSAFNVPSHLLAGTGG
ncbi:hypothetical protein PGB90_003784 [Kerria lacca]